MEPLIILQNQVAQYLERASTNESKTVQLSEVELQAFRSNFGQLCYEIRHGKLDEVYRHLLNDDLHRNGVFNGRDLHNILLILQTMKAAI